MNMTEMRVHGTFEEFATDNVEQALQKAILAAGELAEVALLPDEVQAINDLVQLTPLLRADGPESQLRYDITSAPASIRAESGLSLNPRHLALNSVYRTVRQEFGSYFEQQQLAALKANSSARV